MIAELVLAASRLWKLPELWTRIRPRAHKLLGRGQQTPRPQLPQRISLSPSLIRTSLPHARRIARFRIVFFMWSTSREQKWSTLDERQGPWVFRGTRVPVKALFENLESGARVDEFLAWFPGVTREQVDAVFRHAELSLIEA